MSGVYYFDYGILVVCIDFNVFKYKGLIMFFLSMKMFGIEVCFIK